MRRSRAVLARATAALVVTSLFFGVSGARADSVTDQKHRVEQLAIELNSLTDRITQIDEAFGAAQEQQAALAVEITASQAQVASEQAQLDQLNGTMTDIAVNRFVGNNAHGLSPLFSSAVAYSDAQQFDAMSSIAFDTGAANADDVQSLVRRFNADTKHLQQQEHTATNLIATLTKQKADGQLLITAFTKKAAEAKAKYGELVQQEAERQAEVKARLAAQKFAAQQAAAAKSRSSGGGAAAPAPRGGGGGSGNNAPTEPPPPPVSGKAGLAVGAARSVLGVPYVAFQQTPQTGFDCSGLTTWAWAQAGVHIPHQSGQQFATSPHVPKDQAQPGDLVFYYSPISHVGMYIGGGMMIDSPQTGSVVRVWPVKWDMVVGVARPG